MPGEPAWAWICLHLPFQWCKEVGRGEFKVQYDAITNSKNLTGLKWEKTLHVQFEFNGDSGPLLSLPSSLWLQLENWQCLQQGKTKVLMGLTFGNKYSRLHVAQVTAQNSLIRTAHHQPQWQQSKEVEPWPRAWKAERASLGGWGSGWGRYCCLCFCNMTYRHRTGDDVDYNLIPACDIWMDI